MPEFHFQHSFIVLADTPTRAKRLIMAALRSIETQTNGPAQDNLSDLIALSAGPIPIGPEGARGRTEAVLGAMALSEQERDAHQATGVEKEIAPLSSSAPDEGVGEPTVHDGGVIEFELQLKGDLARAYNALRRSLTGVACLSDWRINGLLQENMDLIVSCRCYCLAANAYSRDALEGALRALSGSDAPSRHGAPKAEGQADGKSTAVAKPPRKRSGNGGLLPFFGGLVTGVKRGAFTPLSLIASDNLSSMRKGHGTCSVLEMYKAFVSELRQRAEVLEGAKHILCPNSVVALGGALVPNAVNPPRRSVFDLGIKDFAGFPTLACYSPSYLDKVFALWQKRRPGWLTTSSSGKTAGVQPWLVFHDTRGFDLETMGCSFAVVSRQEWFPPEYPCYEHLVPLLHKEEYLPVDEQRDLDWRHIEHRWSTFRGALPLVAAFIPQGKKADELVERLYLQSIRHD